MDLTVNLQVKLGLYNYVVLVPTLLDENRKPKAFWKHSLNLMCSRLLR